VHSIASCMSAHLLHAAAAAAACTTTDALLRVLLPGVMQPLGREETTNNLPVEGAGHEVSGVADSARALGISTLAHIYSQADVHVQYMYCTGAVPYCSWTALMRKPCPWQTHCSSAVSCKGSVHTLPASSSATVHV
jgi:hypothetical protein